MDTLNDNIEKNKILTSFSNTINAYIAILEKQKSGILQYILKISDYPSDVSSADYSSQLVNFLNMLKEKNNKIDECISSANNYIHKLKIIKASNDIESLDIPFKDFNEISSNISSCIINVENFFIDAINYTKLDFQKDCSTADPITDQCSDSDNTNQNLIPSLQSSNIPDNLLENTLIISEMQGKVILPYTLENLESILSENKLKYKNINEIIENEFTIPYSNFKNPSFSRFKEAFRLVKNKEQKSIKEAFDLGMELLFNYNLHPAIISACKNIDELDIYLDYLENNETDKFNCFNIKFEIAPSISKK